MFTIGGLSGVTHAVAPSDTQQTDTYYIVAHFHYVLFGGALFGFVGGWYFWWPKVFGYRLSELHGKINFWILLIGFNLTFGPMHILGMQGMSRRYFTYSANQGFNLWNMVATVGAFTIAVGLLIFFANIAVSYSASDEADAARVFEALAEGGEVQMPFEAVFWSKGFGACVDRFGIPWMVDAGDPEPPAG